MPNLFGLSATVQFEAAQSKAHFIVPVVAICASNTPASWVERDGTDTTIRDQHQDNYEVRLRQKDLTLTNLNAAPTADAMCGTSHMAQPWQRYLWLFTHYHAKEEMAVDQFLLCMGNHKLRIQVACLWVPKSGGRTPSDKEACRSPPTPGPKHIRSTEWKENLLLLFAYTIQMWQVVRSILFCGKEMGQCSITTSRDMDIFPRRVHPVHGRNAIYRYLCWFLLILVF